MGFRTKCDWFLFHIFFLIQINDNPAVKKKSKTNLISNFSITIYRRAAAHMALGKYKLALRDYERVCKVRPNDKDAKLKFTECRKIVQQIAFNKAISVEDQKAASVAEALDIESMTVEDKYDGPKLNLDQTSGKDI